MSTAEELKNILSRLVSEEVTEQMKILEETYFAKSKQTIFTKAELAERWGCSTATVSTALKKANVNPVGKRGKEHEYNLEDAENAKSSHDGKVLADHELSWRVRAM